MSLVRTIIGLEDPSGKPGIVLRELFVFLAFCAFMTVLSYPYINYLRSAVADPGDPYLVSWILWWDYHQTFTDPLNLFHSNLFYPFRYTLAFSEHCYGLALLFFPLFALGFKPVTVHAVAVYFGFALCGYGAFRLARTLTGSNGVAWVAGIIFAFIPFRFHLLSHLPYLFSPWIPLVFEALVLFIRARSKKRAAWLGVAFFMSGITTITWFTLSLVPFVFTAVLLLTRYRLWRDRQFWQRGAIALGLASLGLVPFMFPYFWVSRMYGFKRSIDEVKANSAWPIHWLSVENRNKLWNKMGESIPDGFRFKLFPGLLPILFSLVALLFVEPFKNRAPLAAESRKRNWLSRLDALIFFLIALSILTIGFDDTTAFRGFFNWVKSERALAALTVATVARLCIAYPSFFRATNPNLIATLQSERRGDAFWLGILWTVIGFCYSLGWNFFFYRICYDLIPMFRSMRVPTRGAMFAYLGLALLAGLGVQRLAELVVERRPRIHRAAVFAVACALLLVELNAAPLHIVLGDVDPDAVTLRLKETPMIGGVVVLPAGGEFNHRHILRSADHQKPLIVGTSGFNSLYEEKIEAATRAGAIADEFMGFLEGIPTSYIVVENQLIAPERRVDYETFLARAVSGGRLRFINRFDSRDDLYAVVKFERDAKSEAPLPFEVAVANVDQLITEDPVNILGQFRSWSQTLYRIYVASYGELPRYSDFLSDVKLIGRGVLTTSADSQTRIEANVNDFAARWVERAKFAALYKSMTNDGYVDALSTNAGITIAPGDRATLIEQLNSGAATRAQALVTIANNQDFVKKEQNRSLVLLHYFGYLRRNPDDPPDGNLAGFKYWVRELDVSGEVARLPRAFMATGEYQHRAK